MVHAIPRLTVCTGRIRTFIEQPEKQTLAPSCTIYIYDNDLEECLLFIDRALRGGAGVKTQLEKFKPRQPLNFKWQFWLSPVHRDYHLVVKSPELRDRLSAPDWICGSEWQWIKVADSMEEDVDDRLSIRNSWLKFIEMATSGKSIVVDLSALRPAGTKNAVGLTATGPVGYGDGDGSFLSVYERLAAHLENGDMISLMQLFGQLNRVLRRGGTYKNGIVCSGLKYDHPDIKTYLNSDLSSLPGGQKKGIRLDEKILDDLDLCNLVLDQLNKGGLFLEKILGGELYSNVCEEIAQKHRGVCLLAHANAGACESPHDLIEALVSTAEFCTYLHLTWRSQVGDRADIYLPLEEDRQIGVGWCGWANFLRRMKVTYKEHVEALEAYLKNEPYKGNPTANYIAECLVAAYYKATSKCAKIMAEHGFSELDRIWTIAPCQRNWVDYKDPDGYALCRAIDPPFDRYEFRDSHTDTASVGRYDHGQVETMAQVGHELHQRHWEAWQQIMDLTGKAHTMSFDLWRKVDLDWLKDFILRSPLQTTYYQFADKLDQQYLNKGLVWEAIDDDEETSNCSLDEDCISCAE